MPIAEPAPLRDFLTGPNYPKEVTRRRLDALKQRSGVAKLVILERALELGLQVFEADPTLLIKPNTPEVAPK